MLFASGGGEFLSLVMCEQPWMQQGKKTKPFSASCITGQGMIKHSFQCLQMARTPLKHRGYEGGSFPVVIFVESLSDSAWHTSEDFSVLPGPWSEAVLFIYIIKGIRILSTQNRVWKASGKEFKYMFFDLTSLPWKTHFVICRSRNSCVGPSCLTLLSSSCGAAENNHVKWQIQQKRRWHWVLPGHRVSSVTWGIVFPVS